MDRLFFQFIQTWGDGNVVVSDPEATDATTGQSESLTAIPTLDSDGNVVVSDPEATDATAGQTSESLTAIPTLDSDGNVVNDPEDGSGNVTDAPTSRKEEKDCWRVFEIDIYEVDCWIYEVDW